MKLLIVGFLTILVICAIACLTGSILWFTWTYCGLGAKYFYFLPTLYHNIGFWAWIGLAIMLSTLKGILLPSASSSASSSND